MLISLLQKIPVLIVGILLIVGALTIYFRSKNVTKAEFVTKLTAVCAKCGAPATRTQRIIDGVPASFEHEIVMVGAKEHYEPRCRHCHEVPGKPNYKWDE